MSRVLNIMNLADFNNHVDSPEFKITIVDHYADWCGPCKMAAPIIEELSKRHLNVKFIKVNVDHAREISQNRDIQSLPTFEVFCSGRLIETIVGFNKQRIESLIHEYVNK